MINVCSSVFSLLIDNLSPKSSIQKSLPKLSLNCRLGYVSFTSTEVTIIVLRPSLNKGFSHISLRILQYNRIWLGMKNIILMAFEAYTWVSRNPFLSLSLSIYLSLSHTRTQFIIMKHSLLACKTLDGVILKRNGE